MLQTHLLKLEPPYNLICNKEGQLAYHLATLINIDTDGLIPIRSFPIVERIGKLGGDVWEEHELETCFVVCKQDTKEISLFDIKRVMRYYYGWARYPSADFVWKLTRSLYQNKTKIDTSHLWELEDDCCPHVELIFEYDKECEICTIRTSAASSFFFLESIDLNPDSRARPGDDEETTMLKIARLRDAYCMAFGGKIFSNIIFSTSNEEYKDFVEKLNNLKTDITPIG